MTNFEFAEKALHIANGTETAYLWGTFGSPLTDALIRQKVRQYPKNYSESRRKTLATQTGKGIWAWDCVGLIKGILWGWSGDATKAHGGAVYCSNGVPDLNATGMRKVCTEQSGDLSRISVGEAVFQTGHIGIYVGNGTVVQATYSGKYDGVVATPLEEGNWEGHGKLPYLEYRDEGLSAHSEKEISVGDTVTFLGGRHYLSANGNAGYSARAGKATVTRILTGRKHPYHLIHSDRTSNVYGWVDAETVKAE